MVSLGQNWSTRFGSNPWDPSFRRDALAVGLSPTATSQTVPLGTLGAPKGFMGFFLSTFKFIGSMYGIFTYIYHKKQPNVGKYTIHGSSGKISKQIHRDPIPLLSGCARGVLIDFRNARVFRFHETILSFGEPGSLGIYIYIYAYTICGSHLLGLNLPIPNTMICRAAVG